MDTQELKMPQIIHIEYKEGEGTYGNLSAIINASDKVVLASIVALTQQLSFKIGIDVDLLLEQIERDLSQLPEDYIEVEGKP